MSAAADGVWRGWDATTCEATEVGARDTWTPWRSAVDETDSPYVQWFDGGVTNAAFNEVDRHVLSGCGDEVAAIAVGVGAIEATLASGSALLAQSHAISRSELLVRSVIAAKVLTDLGVGARDRILIHLPPCVEQLVWIEAAKRCISAASRQYIHIRHTFTHPPAI